VEVEPEEPAAGVAAGSLGADADGVPDAAPDPAACAGWPGWAGWALVSIGEPQVSQ
jgi:hypothetical protein